jgi:hypothetical protein
MSPPLQCEQIISDEQYDALPYQYPEGCTEAGSRTRTDHPFLTIDLDEGKSGSREDTNGARLPRKAAAMCSMKG